MNAQTYSSDRGKGGFMAVLAGIMMMTCAGCAVKTYASTYELSRSERAVLEKRALEGDGMACRKLVLHYRVGVKSPSDAAEKWEKLGAKLGDPVCVKMARGKAR